MRWLRRLFGRTDTTPPASPASTPGTPDGPRIELPKDDFARLVLRRLQAAGAGEFVYDRQAFRLSRGDKHAFLDNTYAAYTHAEGQQREQILANIIGLLTATHEETEAPLDAVRDQLVTVIRERAYFSLSQLDMQIHGTGRMPEVMVDPLTTWFAKVVVIDAPSHMMLVNEDVRARWGHTSDELFAIGLANLGAATAPSFAADRGVHRGRWNDDYDSARILVPGLFDALHLDGDPVVTIPNRLTLLVAGSNDSDAIRRMLHQAEHIVQHEPRPQNPAPLLVRAEDITDYHVDPTSPVFNAVERAHRFAALMYYGEQKEKLDRLHAKQGKTLHVAKYTLVALEGGLHCSFAPWPKSEATLLPVVDEVAFIDIGLPEDRRCVARVPWARVLEVVPDLLLDAGLFPQRFYVSGFPSQEQFARMAR